MICWYKDNGEITFPLQDNFHSLHNAFFAKAYFYTI